MNVLAYNFMMDNLVLTDGFFTDIQGKTFDPLCIETHKKASGKSRGKQNHTNWIAPPKMHQYSNQVRLCYLTGFNHNSVNSLL